MGKRCGAWLSVTLAVGLTGCCLTGEKGCGPEVAPWAIPTNTESYGSYYVGGGAVAHGDERGPNEGTWGWDYFGWCWPARVALLWSHGKLWQGGPGAYQTDGPKIVKQAE